jgi:hypothetical protein
MGAFIPMARQNMSWRAGILKQQKVKGLLASLSGMRWLSGYDTKSWFEKMPSCSIVVVSTLKMDQK